MYGNLMMAQAAFPARLASRGAMGMMIPDVPWWDSTAIGWAGTDPIEGEGLGHGLFEQVR